MILHQKTKTPFIIRLLPAFLHPGILIMTALSVGACYLAYLAIQEAIASPGEKTIGMTIGVFIAVLVVGIFTYGVYVGVLRDIIIRLVLIEIVPTGLRVQELKYDTLSEVTYAATELKLEARKVESTSRTHGSTKETHHLSYHLKLFSKEAGKRMFMLRDSQTVIGEILEKIDQQKLIPLEVGEQEFLMAFQSDREATNSLSWKIIKTVFMFAVIGLLSYLGYQAYSNYQERGYLHSLVTWIRTWSSPYVGNWQVRVGSGTYNVLLSPADSTVYENGFKNSGRWRIREMDGGNLRMIITNKEGEYAHSYDMLERSDALIKLDGGITLTKTDDETPSTLTGFDKLMGVLSNQFLIIPKMEQQDSVIATFVTDFDNTRRGFSILAKENSKWVGSLIGYGGVSLLVLDTAGQKVLDHINIMVAGGDCNANTTRVSPSEKTVIQVEIGCVEGDPNYNLYELTGEGKLIVHSGTPQASTWVTRDAFTNFPRKWYPLVEGSKGLERQQLCGSERFIEIVKVGNGFIWRQMGFQDVLEETIENFEVSGKEVDVYHISLKNESGKTRTIDGVNDEVHPGVMRIDGNLYTSQPELFQVNNDKSECL